MSQITATQPAIPSAKGSMPDRERFFVLLQRLAGLTASVTDLNKLLSATVGECIEHLPLSGVVMWLRAQDQEMLGPGASRLPRGASTSAISEEHALVARILVAGHLILKGDESLPLMLLPNTAALAVAPIRSGDTLLGLLGYIAHPTTLEPLVDMLETSANLLSGSFASAWLRRQQAEADDVADTLFQFASELRIQRSLNTILGMLNNLALRVFNCDWSGVYIWQDNSFKPIQVMTRVGQQAVDDEPLLHLHDNPMLEILLTNPKLLYLYDLRDQPNALPVYLERHALRGLVLVPLQQTPSNPLGLLSLGYRAPLAPLSGRTTALAQGLARMVAVALERERERSHTEA